MRHEQATGNDFEALLKRLPRKDLSLKAQANILDYIKSATRLVDHRRQQRIILRRSAMAICLLAVIVFFPLLIREARQHDWTSSVFSPERRPLPVQVSPLFDLLDKDGKVVYHNRVRGIEGKIGFLESGDIVANARESIAKMFWYVWGEPDVLLFAHLQANAVHLQTGASFVLNDCVLQGPIYSADGHALTSFQPFPNKGLWRIDVTINGKPYDSIFVQVKDEYLRTKTVKFMVSKDDVAVGTVDAFLQVPEHRDAQTLEVRMYPIKDQNRVRTLTYQQIGKYNQVGEGPITMYQGKLQFDETGEWQIEVLGEKTTVQVKAKE